MADKKDVVYLGTELKLNISIDPIDSLTMDDYFFELDFYCQEGKHILIAKEIPDDNNEEGKNPNKNELVRVDANNYVALVHTNLVGEGTLKCRITAQIPDELFDDGIRTQIIGINTGIKIKESV